MGLFSALIKVVATPVTIVADVVEVAQGKEPKNTEKVVDSIINELDGWK